MTRVSPMSMCHLYDIRKVTESIILARGMDILTKAAIGLPREDQAVQKQHLTRIAIMNLAHRLR
jgi:hypothetical protein